MFDSSGNQVFSGKGRKSRRFRELEAEKGLYRKEGEELISIHAETLDFSAIEKERLKHIFKIAGKIKDAIIVALVSHGLSPPKIGRTLTR